MSSSFLHWSSRILGNLWACTVLTSPRNWARWELGPVKGWLQWIKHLGLFRDLGIEMHFISAKLDTQKGPVLCPLLPFHSHLPVRILLITYILSGYFHVYKACTTSSLTDEVNKTLCVVENSSLLRAEWLNMGPKKPGLKSWFYNYSLTNFLYMNYIF